MAYQERPEVIEPWHHREVQQDNVAAWINANWEGAGKLAREVRAVVGRRVCRRSRRCRHGPSVQVRELLRPGRQPLAIGARQRSVEPYQPLRSGACGDGPAIPAVRLANRVVQQLRVYVKDLRAIVDAVRGNGEAAPDESVEKHVALLPAAGDAGELGILPFHAETAVPHHEDEEPRLALREAVIGDRLNPFSGCHLNISSASPPWCPPAPRLPPRPSIRRLDPR